MRLELPKIPRDNLAMFNFIPMDHMRELRRVSRVIRHIADEFDRIEPGLIGDGTLIEAPVEDERTGPSGSDKSPLGFTMRSPLPDPRLLRRIIRQRRLRTQFFDSDLFGDPAWDMLLDLAAARAEFERVSVTSLCIASGVPSTTALRWIKLLHEAKLVERSQDDSDRRRAFISLSDRGAALISRYFRSLGRDALVLT